MSTLVKHLQFLIAALVLSVAFQSNANTEERFPTHPDAQMTPGKLCSNGTTRRYPEGIPYCNRNVERGLKADIFKAYDEDLGFETRQMNRGDFKIDHYIPLCAGGSNSIENLWPQHRTVFAITDPMEPLVCEKMSEGVLKQAEAIELIKRGKNNLEQVKF
ncbi:MAG: hypothetical protein EOP05_23155 [Proteobacteria bacterium]|nr:MAG: hypothetical protein EOP05_23155 [Pseudomonadota bacterium]